jgi:hypothetical protein
VNIMTAAPVKVMDVVMAALMISPSIEMAA